MNRERLLEGAAFLENLQLGPTEQFDIDHWASDKIFRRDVHGNLQRECGTAGCAMGWFAYKGLWGLRTENGDVLLDDPEISDEPLAANWDAAEQVFGIDTDIARWLFQGGSYARGAMVTKEMVAARMRHIAAGGTPETWKEPA